MNTNCTNNIFIYIHITYTNNKNQEVYKSKVLDGHKKGGVEIIMNK